MYRAFKVKPRERSNIKRGFIRLKLRLAESSSLACADRYNEVLAVHDEFKFIVSELNVRFPQDAGESHASSDFNISGTVSGALPTDGKSSGA